MPLSMLEATLAENPYVTKVPFPKQIEFLRIENPDVLYGGAAGGGKSGALLLGALQFADVPGYAAAIFRRHLTDLKLPGALIDKSDVWLKDTPAKWNANENRWRFPGGGTLQFGYLENDADCERYNSAEFQYIGIDEGSQFTPNQLKFLFSRLRRTAEIPVPLRYRIASNPGGCAHDFLKRKYIDGGNPKAIFIPAKIADNHALNAQEYRETSLSHLDPLMRRRLEDGDWTAVTGGRFQEQWFRRYSRRGDYVVMRCNGVDKEFDIRQSRRFMVVDPAASEKQTADYTAISSYCVSPWGDLVWLGCNRYQLEIPDIIPKVKEAYRRWQPSFVGIEAIAANRGVYQFACRETNPVMAVKQLDPKGREKLAHATAAIVLAESGRIYVPKYDSADFELEDALSELTRFTGDVKQDDHDDVVDTLSYAAELVGSGVFTQPTQAPAILSSRR